MVNGGEGGRIGGSAHPSRAPDRPEVIFAAIGSWPVGDAWASLLRRCGIRPVLHTSDPQTRKSAMAAWARGLRRGSVATTIIDLGHGRAPYVNRLVSEIGPNVIAIEAQPGLAAEIQRVRLKSGSAGGLSERVHPAVFEDPAAQLRVADAAGVPVMGPRGSSGESTPGALTHVTGVAASGVIVRYCCYRHRFVAHERRGSEALGITGDSGALCAARAVIGSLGFTGLFRVDTARASSGGLAFVGMVLGLHAECLEVQKAGVPLVPSYAEALSVIPRPALHAEARVDAPPDEARERLDGGGRGSSDLEARLVRIRGLAGAPR